MKKIIVINDPSLNPKFLEKQLGDGYIVLISNEIEGYLKVFEV